ncbi:MAG TPA: HD domain-containing protein [Bacillota bacterium]|nr:HD domain-containing protein [Bacillota bacterium]
MQNMMSLMEAMIEFDQGDPKLIHHFLKVYELARTIGHGENLSEDEQFTLESAALVHDIGIHEAMQKFGSGRGKYQEIVGSDAARKLLTSLAWPLEVTERVAFLVGHHHTYSDIDRMDYRILVEADFLVNLFEGQASPAACREAYDNIFRTETGKRLFAWMVPLEAE